MNGQKTRSNGGQGDRAQAEQARPVAGHFHAAGLRLSFLEWGDPAAPALVLLHGGLEHAHAWDAIASVLAADWRVIAPDLRGHGDSQWACGPDYGVLDFAADLAALFRHLDLRSAHIVGHSLGGAVALHFAALYPEHVRGVCAIEGLRPVSLKGPESDEERIDAIRTWADRRDAAGGDRKRTYADLDAATDRLMAHDPLLTADLARHLAREGTVPADGGLRWKYDRRVRQQSLSGLLGPHPSAFWRRISCPVLLVYGARSWAASPAEDGRLAHFRQARVETVQDAGHNVHHHQPAAFLHLLKAFLAETA